MQEIRTEQQLKNLKEETILCTVCIILFYACIIIPLCSFHINENKGHLATLGFQPTQHALLCKYKASLLRLLFAFQPSTINIIKIYHLT